MDAHPHVLTSLFSRDRYIILIAVTTMCNPYRDIEATKKTALLRQEACGNSPTGIFLPLLEIFK